MALPPFSTLMSTLSADPVWVHGAAALLALLLVHAGLVKLRAVAWFRGVVADYRLLPQRLELPAAIGLPLLELLAGVALLLPVSRGPAALLAAVLFGAYALAMAVNLRRGRRDVDCGCGGRDAVMPLSWWLVARNGVLVLICGLAAVPPEPPLPGAAGWLGVAGLVVVGLVLHALVTELAANLARLEEYV